MELLGTVILISLVSGVVGSLGLGIDSNLSTDVSISDLHCIIAATQRDNSISFTHQRGNAIKGFKIRTDNQTLIDSSMRWFIGRSITVFINESTWVYIEHGNQLLFYGYFKVGESS